MTAATFNPDITSLTTAIQSAAANIGSNAITMMTTVAPYAIGILGVSVAFGIGMRWLRSIKG